MSLMSMFFFSGCGGDGSKGQSSSTALLSDNVIESKEITSIEIKPQDIIVPKGSSGTYTAIAYYSDGTYQDITKQATWKSSDPSIVSIQTNPINGGFAEALAVGTTTITATYNAITSNVAKVEVTGITLVSIEVDPIIETVANGIDVQYRAIGIFSNAMHADLTQFVTFNSSNTNVATIDGTGIDKGLAHTLSVGTTNITATFHGVSSNTATLNATSAVVTNIQITPADASAAVGTTGRYFATAYLSDGTSADITSQSTWQAADPSIVYVVTSGDHAGYGKALAVGNTTVTANFAGITSNTATIEVTAAELVSIQVNPVNETVAKGINVKYNAIGLYSDQTTEDLTLFATWKSSNTAVATIDGVGARAGLAQTLNVGSTNITATFDGVTSNTASLTVTEATITSIQITPADVSVPKGTTGTYTAIAYYTDNTNADITKQATWQSADTTVVNIVTSGEEAGYAIALEEGSTTIRAYYGGIESNIANITVNAAMLLSIQVSPVNESVPKGIDVSYSAIGIYSDYTYRNLTLFVTWQSSDLNIATITDGGLSSGSAQTLNVGTTDITASFEGVTGNTILTVTPAIITSIQVTPAIASAPKGTTGTYTATAYFTDDTTQNISTQATWISHDTHIVSIVTSGVNGGFAEALSVGNTTIQASFEGHISNISTIEVTPAVLKSIVIAPVDVKVPNGVNVKYNATGIYSDGTSIDLTLFSTWHSSNVDVATIDGVLGQIGLAHTHNTGTTTITASFDGLSASTLLTVTPAIIASIQITPANLIEPKGTSSQLTATAIYTDKTTEDVTDEALWLSSNSDIVFVHNDAQHGLAELLEVGTSTINAWLGTIKGTSTIEVIDIALVNIIISPLDQSIPNGLGVQYSATGVYNNGAHTPITNDVLWKSSNNEVAIIDTAGFAQSLTTGTTSISATLEGISSSTPLEVTTATVTGLEISPRNLVEPVGSSGQLSATAIYSDGSVKDVTHTATWRSSDPEVVHVGTVGANGGFTELLSVGESDITATLLTHVDTPATKNLREDTIHITVTDAVLESIIISPINESSVVSLEVDYSAVGVYSDGTQTPIDRDVSWISSDISKATVDVNGVATCLAQGQTIITATHDGISASTPLTIANLETILIALSPVNTEVSVGYTVPYTVTALFTNAPPKDITHAVVWESSNEAVAIVENGLATALSAGVTTIKAHINYLGVNYEDTANLIVNNGILESIVVSTNTPVIQVGESTPFTATGLYDTDIVKDITNEVIWSTSKLEIADVSNATDTKGLVSGHLAGVANITAVLDAVSGDHPIIVNAASLVSIDVNPATTTIANGLSQQYEAIATYSDGSSHDITDSVLWNSSISLVAQIDSSGLAVSNGAGTTTITATHNTLSGTAQLSVIDPVVITFSISPTSPSIALGTTQQFNATLTVDGVDNEVGELSVWSSSDTGVATISNAVDLDIGLATSVSAGTTTITASYYHEANGQTYSASTILGIADLSHKPNFVRIEPEPLPGLPVNDTLQLHLIGIWVIGGGAPNYEQDLTFEPQTVWNSSSARIASVDNSGDTKGLAHGLEVGTTDVKGKYISIEDTETLTVVP